ncbi:MAG: GTP cyclohydrolase II [Acidimicrobiia bacterium]|nr:GTP cyclohydrolase II [Acidimicrobiia bacterium]
MTSASTVFAASAPFRTIHHGRFQISVTNAEVAGGRHLVLVKGRVADVPPGQPAVLCRIASACVTSTALDADDCDCAGQNHVALARIDREGSGVLIYLDQEGRGNGLVAKIQALNGKAAGLDTFAAIEDLGLPADARHYGAVPRILEALGVTSVRLLTNNPDKAAAIAAAGVRVTELVPCLDPEPPPGARPHLRAKAARGHLLSVEDHDDRNRGDHAYR